jgi:hypothetical protein
VDAFRLCTYVSDVAVDLSIAELGAGEQAGISDQNGQLVTQNSSPEAKIELFRSLEALAETAGRFRLNVELPIPFDA